MSANEICLAVLPKKPSSLGAGAYRAQRSAGRRLYRLPGQWLVQGGHRRGTSQDLCDLGGLTSKEVMPWNLTEVYFDCNINSDQHRSFAHFCNAQVWFAREYPCYAPNSLLLDNALASMGAGVPSALVPRSRSGR